MAIIDNIKEHIIKKWEKRGHIKDKEVEVVVDNGNDNNNDQILFNLMFTL
jgi:hypothetical protein